MTWLDNQSSSSSLRLWHRAAHNRFALLHDQPQDVALGTFFFSRQLKPHSCCMTLTNGSSVAQGPERLVSCCLMVGKSFTVKFLWLRRGYIVSLLMPPAKPLRGNESLLQTSVSDHGDLCKPRQERKKVSSFSLCEIWVYNYCRGDTNL